VRPTAPLPDRHPHGRAVGLVLVLLCCGLPLFLGLGLRDLGNDEAIYSYSVDRAVELHQWLTPRDISGDGPFVEKPPLKTWIVSAGIRLGLPDDEFGLRVFDPLFATIAFAYVFALGCRLSGPLCGLTAVLVLFTFQPLVFEHGVRTNNMESGLLLTYCGGVYHFGRWRESAATGGGRWHAHATTLFFAFGFLMKFVAALFLPIVMVAAWCWPPKPAVTWSAVSRAWRVPGLVAAAVIAPWFLYETRLLGSHFWRVILGDHVVKRFTSFLDPAHLHPWYFYLQQTYLSLNQSASLWAVGLGLVALAGRAWAGRDALARLLLVWAIVPIVLMSIGTSKLYHYAYPFIPPLAIGAGLAAAIWWDAAVPSLRSALGAGWIARARVTRAWPRRLLNTAAWAAVGLAAWTLFRGSVSIHVRGAHVFQSSSPFRPLAIAAMLFLAAGSTAASARTLAAAGLALVLPLFMYHLTVEQFSAVRNPLHVLRQCVSQQIAAGTVARGGVYVSEPSSFGWPYRYYLRAAGPWVEGDGASFDAVLNRLSVRGKEAPVLLADRDFADLQPRLLAAGTFGTGAVRVVADDESAGVILLPGPFAACADGVVAAGWRSVAIDASRPVR
jgi:4-amino-4-deoxy-L-arabinose transferase-like glycosyltransferase